MIWGPVYGILSLVSKPLLHIHPQGSSGAIISITVSIKIAMHCANFSTVNYGINRSRFDLLPVVNDGRLVSYYQLISFQTVQDR